MWKTVYLSTVKFNLSTVCSHYRKSCCIKTFWNVSSFASEREFNFWDRINYVDYNGGKIEINHWWSGAEDYTSETG
ncbi:MAG: hypothetical protein EA411_02915 [Saprospirales bacterium]|nr:MAG: hypothetical protein EA411_02915 [Saprospirales bacterium]